AVADGDSIQAIIKASAVNNDGSLKVGYTAPGIEGQASVIACSLMTAEVDPETISYIEAHGTGTDLGDPVEIAALTQAFGLKTRKKGFCAIGSLKSNMGHLDAAAGVAGLIKTVLALKYGQIPPSLHFEQPNAKIDFADSPFYVNDKLSEWKTGHDIPRRAGVSSFGIGGTNAHVILEQAPCREKSAESRPYQLLIISAKTDSALEAATTNLSEYLKQNPDINLADVAYTLQAGRKHFSNRKYLVCKDINEAVTKLVSGKDVYTGFYKADQSG
ncbi:MAG: type I polyketide synthase, partial [Deltaproteobacteria bacterium]|nr:type I polyketide synthase [Deltaproteobacteria bacterium]